MKHKLTRLLCITLLVVAHTISFIRPASAEIIQNERFIVTFQDYIPCLDEWVTGTAELHQIWIFNAGKVDSIHTNLTGTAVGQTTGNQFIWKNNYKDDFTNYFCGGTATARAHARLIGLGKAPNQDTEFLVTYEFDANCNALPPTVEIVDFRCK